MEIVQQATKKTLKNWKDQVTINMGRVKKGRVGPGKVRRLRRGNSTLVNFYASFTSVQNNDNVCLVMGTVEKY